MPAVDTWYQNPAAPTSPPQNAALVTKSDTVDLVNTSLGLWVGGAGAINVITAGGQTVLLSGVTAGTYIPLRITRLMSTSTTATLVVALY